MALLACSTATDAQAQTSYYISLHDALVDFQNIWDVDLAYDAKLVENKWTTWSKPIKRDPKDDLKVLLVGTGLISYRLASGTYGLAQATTRRATISGTVADSYTGLPLEDATIQIAGTPIGAATDDQGRFTLKDVAAGNVVLVFRFVGYETIREPVLLVPGGHQSLDAKLEQKQIVHDPIDVWDIYSHDMPQVGQLYLVEGASLSHVGGVGTADVRRSARNRVPNVALDEKSSNLHIQGGGQGEHRFMLDGSPVFEPVHGFGIFSGLNPFALSSLQIYKAGFPASQGSYSSGVVRAEHAFGDTSGTILDAYLDPLSFNARVNFSNMNRGSGAQWTLMGALRTSIWSGWWSGIRSSAVDDLLLDWNEPDVFLSRASFYTFKKLFPNAYIFYSEQLNHIPPPSLPDVTFSDLHVAGQLLLGQSWLRGSYYRGGNRLQGRHLIPSLLENDESIPPPDSYDWINQTGQLTWSYSASPDILLATKLRGSHYRLNHKYAGLNRSNAVDILYDRLFIDTTPAEDGNKIREVGLEHAVELSHGAGSLTASLEYVLSDHRFIVREVFEKGILHERLSSSLALYFEEIVTAAPGLTVTAGTRMTYIQARNEFYAEPRLSVEAKVRTGKRGTFVSRLAGGLYYQFLNLFDVSTLSPSTLTSSTRIWLPVDESLSPPKSYHVAADLGMRFLDFWTLHLEGYYKALPHTFRIDYPRLWSEDKESSGVEVENLTAQADFVASAKGFAYGTALVLERESSRLRLHARYEHNIAEREYAFRGNEIRMLPAPWSEPHRLDLAAEATVFGALRSSARWRGVWGRVWGFRQTYYDYLATDFRQGLSFDGFDFHLPTAKQHRLTPLKQLDLGLAYQANVRQLTLQIRVDLLNALNRRNQAELFLKEVATPPNSSTESDADLEETPDLLIENKDLIGRSLSLAVQLRW